MQPYPEGGERFEPRNNVKGVDIKGSEAVDGNRQSFLLNSGSKRQVCLLCNWFEVSSFRTILKYFPLDENRGGPKNDLPVDGSHSRDFFSKEATCVWKMHFFYFIFLYCSNACIENIVKLYYTTENQLQPESTSFQTICLHML